MRNKIGGKKHKRGKRISEDDFYTKQIEYAEDGQEYARVIRRLGGSRLLVECTDGKERSAIIRGKLKKRVWMNPGDIILVSVDATGKDQDCYIELKYDKRQSVILRQKGLIKFDNDEIEEDDNLKFTDRNDVAQQPNVNNITNLDDIFKAEGKEDSESSDSGIESV